MDPIAYHPPTEHRTAASFVNCMPFMGRCWTLLQEAQALGLPVKVYGIDGPDGIVKPNTALVDLMAGVGWGWHDKAQGDGFGHVLHTWAAVGRPLVGHAGHYAGKMGERFWLDGETCIDLDRHSVAEAVEMIRNHEPEPARRDVPSDPRRVRRDRLRRRDGSDQEATHVNLPCHT